MRTPVPVFFVSVGVLLTVALAGCGTTHPLPPFERPLARTEFQTVRTTAYTHTESDHLEYGNHNALGGTLHAAGPPVLPTSREPAAALEPYPATIVNEEGGFHRSPPPVQSGGTGGIYAPPTVYGSAAADWSRWPAGTVFRIESTGQVYRVDDYGWALAGRNTIDLYEASTHAMNEWGVRREVIHVLRWGDPAGRLRGHQKYRHIRRMVLELEGRERAAANLE